MMLSGSSSSDIEVIVFIQFLVPPNEFDSFLWSLRGL